MICSHRLLTISGVFFFLPLFFGGSCKSSENQKKTNSNANVIAIDNLRQNYPPYQYLRGDFIIKGNMSGTVFTYGGIITSQQNANPGDFKFSMIVRDMIFLSPLVSIEINNDNLKWFDHLNKKVKNESYTDSSILFFSNQQIPATILVALLTGNLPEKILLEGKLARDGSSLKYSSSEFEAVGFFTDSILTTLIYNPREDYHQVVYKISGSIKNNKSRYFPENIKIMFNDNEFIDITFKKVELK